MITKEVTKKELAKWKALWLEYKGKLKPNRKSGEEVLLYLQNKYVLTEIFEENALEVVSGNVLENTYDAEKLPEGIPPAPKAFFLENAGNGEVFFKDENKDREEIRGGNIAKIFVGIDTVTGFFTVEGSTMLWDELSAFRGLDEKDLENYVIVAQYIESLERFGLLQTVLADLQ